MGVATVLLLIVAAAAFYLGFYAHRGNGPKLRNATIVAAEPPTFVGSKVCGTCHTDEFHDWLGSHHQLAMQPATAATVLGDFANATFSDGGVASNFFRDDDKFMVRTDGSDGKPHDYRIGYSFGVSPLQQYLIGLPGGRLQAFGDAWDSRPRAAGGQRWFALYPGSEGQPSSPLYWTAPDQTWNFACAACHSTDLRKNYDAKTRTYATTYSEISVGCEACHGPGSAHVAWARHPQDYSGSDPKHGLTIALDERAGVSWKYDSRTGIVRRNKPRTTDREIQTCARCHSLGTPIHEDYVHGQPLGDDYRVALLDADLYFPDGQIKGEVYEYGSFIQSRMFHAGVTCSDCHNPHTARLRIKGNGLCTSCHLAAKYDSPSHYHHPAESAGAQCVSCHMPTRTYMRIDKRRDHSIRVPRPDLSVVLGTPNACNECHSGKTPQWAADWITKWYGPKRIGFQHFGPALQAGRLGAPDAQRLLTKLVGDSSQPAIARATALKLLAGHDDRQNDALLRKGSEDASPLVRRAAAGMLSAADLKANIAAMHRLLDDPVRAVRIAAADSLAGVKHDTLPPDAATALDNASAEYVAAQSLNADRPEAHLDLAFFFGRQGELDGARSELTTALSLDPTFSPAAVNLADLDRTLGHDDEAAAVLQRAMRHSPNDPSLLYALGLLEVRQGQKAKALDSLADAARLAPSNPRYAYVYAVALNDAGNIKAAIAVLERSLKLNPYDRDSLAALVSFCTHVGDRAKALKYAKMLDQLSRKERPSG
ncbi:MAG: tetratricopeptide repeat protein [Gammaproteobacteria bacterium]